jgi:acyl-CoA reductase-like NAD-dependent aldehyde dehydrogenase
MASEVSLMIGGKPHPVASRFERLDPMSGEVATQAAAAAKADALAAADAAAAAFPAWSERGPNERRALLMRAASALESKATDFVAAMMAETGSTEGWARFNLMLAAGMVREAAAMTTQISGEVIPSDKPGCIAMAVRQAAGVVLGIAPWNAPIILGVRAIAMPLACGNTVILKGSEVCPRTHALIVDAFIEAGFAGGIVNFITNAPKDAADIVGVLIDHPGVKRVNFTGSTAVGRIVAVRAAQNLKPVLLELGGKAPFLVLEDADLDEAVKAAAFGAFMNQGQICMSTERIIVVDSIADEFVAKFKAKVDTMKTGNPREGKTPLGAVIDAKTVKRVESLVSEAVSQGAKQVSGGPSTGVLMAATVIDRVTASMKLFREESFGPVVAVTRARDEADAIRLANDTEYGLSAAVFTKDAARGLRVAKQIRSGICHINGPTVHDEAQMPFGGVNASGYGRFGGKAGVEAFTDLRWITIETLPGHYPI